MDTEDWDDDTVEEGGEDVDENGTEDGLNSGMGESKSGGGWCFRIVNTFWRCKTTLKSRSSSGEDGLPPGPSSPLWSRLRLLSQI